MRRFFEHVQPGGTLAVTWLDIARDHPDGADECFVKEARLADGSTIRRTYRAWFDESTGLEHTDDVYERLRDGVVVDRQRRLRSPATRHYPRREIAGLHESAGFEQARLLSLNTGAEAKPEDRFVVSVARRPR
jgi:hypothetical protein